MTEDEQRLAVAYSERDEARTKIAALEAENAQFVEQLLIKQSCHEDMQRIMGINNDLTAKIAALEAENATLRKRLVVDDAKVERALKSFGSTLWAGRYLGMRAALEAALCKDDANV